MHELSIAMSILDMVQEESERRGGAHVSKVHLKWGPLSGVEKKPLLSAFELAREGTDLSDCELVIQDVPVTATCPRCGTDQPVVSIQEVCCSICGTPTPDIVTGRDLEVAALEIDSGEVASEEIAT